MGDRKLIDCNLEVDEPEGAQVLALAKLPATQNPFVTPHLDLCPLAP